jgi:hypothetical protein
MLRTDYVLYLACPQCGELWSVNKPAPPKDDI